MNIENLSPEDRKLLLKALDKETIRRMGARPADFFPWHPQQVQILELPSLVLDEGREVRIIGAIGGNGSGKSKIGGGLISKIIHRKHPLFHQFKTVDRLTGEVRQKRPEDPLRIWVVPPTGEKLRQDIWEPADGLGLPDWIGTDLMKEGYPKKSPDYVIKTIYDDEIFGKTQEQNLLTFEASEVDIIWFDEEPLDEAIFNSCLMRLRATHGFILLTFTPLHGLSWSYERLWKPLIIEGRARAVGDRSWVHVPEKGRCVVFVQMGTRDNPIAADYADEIESDHSMGEAEKRARLDGRYGYVEGALLPRLSGLDLDSPLPDQEIYVVDALPGQRKGAERLRGDIARWGLFADPNKSYGAILVALDHDGNLFFVDEHLEDGWADKQHLEAFKKIERAHTTGRVVEHYADYGAAGKHSMVNLAYYGMHFQNVQKGPGSVSQSIKKLRGLTYIDPKHTHPLTHEKGAPRVYFYRPGLLHGRLRSRLAEQLSLARQSENPTDPPDTPHKSVKNRLDLFDCARYAAMMFALAPADAGIGHEPEAMDIERRRTTLVVQPDADDDGVNPLNTDFIVPAYRFFF